MSTNSEKVAHQKSFEVEVDVPGTPEEIWQAIATGPGVTLWFTRRIQNVSWPREVVPNQ